MYVYSLLYWFLLSVICMLCVYRLVESSIDEVPRSSYYPPFLHRIPGGHAIHLNCCIMLFPHVFSVLRISTLKLSFNVFCPWLASPCSGLVFLGAYLRDLGAWIHIPRESLIGQLG